MEAAHKIIQANKRSAGNTLLDAACGTGQHVRHLAAYYEAEGLDLDANLLAIARERLPDLTFYEADMRDFDLGKQYDVITCLFSSIAYVKTVAALEQTAATFAKHLKPGGVALVEGWLDPDVIMHNHIGMDTVDQPDLKICRTSRTLIVDRLSVLEMHYLIATPEGITHEQEQHQLALFTDAEYRAAFQQAGLDVTLHPEGLTGRSLYIASKAFTSA